MQCDGFFFFTALMKPSCCLPRCVFICRETAAPGFFFFFLTLRLFFHLRAEPRGAERSGWTLREAFDALQSLFFCAEELRLWCDGSGGGEEEEEVHANPPPETRTEEEVGVI